MLCRDAAWTRRSRVLTRRAGASPAPPLLHAAIFLVSAAAIIFQVAQTRLFSASLGYHLTYLVISVSLLGVGAGATLSALIDRRPSRPARSTLAVLLGGSSLLALFAETHIEPNGPTLGLAIAAAYLLGALPFAFASWFVVRSLREDPARSGSLYGVDLAGAAAGSVLAYLAIPVIGVPALYALAAVLAAAAVATRRPRELRSAASLALAAAALLVLVLWSETLTPVLAGPEKVPLSAREFSDWDPLARLDVFSRAGTSAGYDFLMDPAYAGPRPAALTLILDLGAATPILAAGDMSALRSSIIAAPYQLLERPSVLVIGPGGGIDLKNALVHGARQVDAVEVNRGVIDLMRGRYAEYSGNIYGDPRVRVHADEARSWMRRSPERYDLIVMTVVDSFTALANGSYALTEAYLYTREAFADYARHTTEGGMLAVSRWYLDPPIEMLHTAQLAAGGLRSAGVPTPERSLLVLRRGTFALLLARRQAFDEAATAAVRRFAQERGFTIEYDPLRPSDPFRAAIADTSSVPATDDRPFFFSDTTTSRSGGIPVAYAILYLALVLASVLSYAVLVRPLFGASRAAISGVVGRRTTLHALLVGLGFIAAEILLLQRLTLYLGQPTLALALGLAALLLGAAAGSAASTHLRAPVAGAAIASAVLVAVVLALFTFVSDATLAWPLWARLAVAAAGVGAVGVPLGAVFPEVLARAGSAHPELVPWAWAMNGVASVIGSILAVAVAMTFGFVAVGAGAVACYLAVGATAGSPPRR